MFGTPKRPDVVIITGDAHVDHPSFPAALLSRVLEHAGFSVGVIARPDVTDPLSIAVFGAPRLFFGVTAGALDSMVANYTALRRRRTDDSYAPQPLTSPARNPSRADSPDSRGRGASQHRAAYHHASASSSPVDSGRPDRAVTVYCNLVRRAFGKDVIVVAGGVEAALRRFSHYDYWSDSIRRPLLMDCGADLLVHGMGEGPIVELARRVSSALATGMPLPAAIAALHDVPGVVFRRPKSAGDLPRDAVRLPAHEDVCASPLTFALAHKTAEEHREEALCQECSGMLVVANPPWPPLACEDLNRIYSAPFSRDPHPMYGGARIPALEQARFSITSHRGCAGGCAFCAISSIQGRRITSRAEADILDEVARIVSHPDFKGTINDVGGPTANMYGYSCDRNGRCFRPSCLWPRRCANLKGDQRRYLGLLQAASKVRGVKHLFVTTGVRMDLALDCPDFLSALVASHTSGHLKVAPEHVVPHVLALMRKGGPHSFERFLDEFDRRSAKRLQSPAKRAGRQFVLPYLMAAHPGCRLEDMVDLALFLARRGIKVEQCQIFTPTPGTTSSVMYATGIDPWSGSKVFVERSDAGKRLQKALILHHLPENREAIRQALRTCGRLDVMGDLVPEARSKRSRA